MAKKLDPLGETLGISDTLEGITAVVRAFYGAEKTLRKRPAEHGQPDKYQILHESGAAVQFAYVYSQFDNFYFASIPSKK